MSSDVVELERAADRLLDDWREVAVAEVATMLPGFAFKSENFVTDTDAGLPLVRIRDLGLTNTATRYVGDYDEAFAVRHGDILVGMDGTFEAVRWQGGKALLNQRVLKLSSARPDAIDEGYLFYRVQPALSELEQTISGTTVKHLSTKDLKRLVWKLPPLDEQRRIAEVLRSVDEAIAAADIVLAKAKKVRQSILDELIFHNPGPSLSRRETYRLSDLISIAHGFAFKSEYFTTNRDDPILLTPGNFSVEKTLYFGERTKHYSGPIPDGYVLENGSLVVVMTDLTQDMAILGNAVEINAEAVVLHNQRIGRVSLLNPDLLTKGYARLLLNSGPVQAQIKATASGSTVRHTAPSRILECEVQLPPLDEQMRIVEVASSLDDIVIAEERRRSDVEAVGPLAHLRDLKAKVAHDLLSGRVRVPA